MPTGSSLGPREHAKFAVISRLISCLVTEQILRAVYIPFERPIHDAAGITVVLSIHTISESVNFCRPFNSDDIFIIIPLHHPPVFKDHEIREHGQLVGLLDPLDMLPYAYEFRQGAEVDEPKDDLTQSILDCLKPPPWDMTTHGRLFRTSDPVSLWRKLLEGLVIPGNLHDVIAQELQSSLDWQALAYENPPSCPTLHSPAIEWEQSLVSGHPTHPMHRARMLPSSSFPENSMVYDWYHPRIRFVRVPRSQLDILGRFEEISKDLTTKAFQQAGETPPGDAGFIYMPVHELQIGNILSKFQNIEILDSKFYLAALAQSSIRTVVVPDFPGIALKLAVGVKISSSLRTISHFTANFGPRFSEDVVPKLAVNPKILAIELEPTSAVYRTSDPEIAKHFTAVIREEYKTSDGEALIVVAALLEMDHAGVPPGISAVQHVFMLDTGEKREAFLDKCVLFYDLLPDPALVNISPRYIQVACEAMLPALIHNGVAFEAHAQNVLARFDVATGELRGFVLRDLGGLRIHPPTLRASIGVDFQFLPDHCVATNTLEEIFPKFYHTFVHNHIQRLIRLLGLHYNGRGWEMLRKHMGSVIPEDHPAWNVWMNPKSTSVDSKCLMRMRMRDSYRDMVYSPYPNMIQYRPQPQSVTDRRRWLRPWSGVCAMLVICKELIYVTISKTFFLN
ncbi:IucC family-domain-containing protein [Flammula alnicola]|nr:IucC family-domain-containing protein [Flammula alnicola]